MMKLSVVSLLLSLAAATGAAVPPEIFQNVKDDDGAAIRATFENDPAAIESIGPGGQTPLLHAILMGKATAVTTLLELGANTAATEKDGYDVLHAAGFQGRAEILEELLEKFASQKAAGGFSLDPSTDMHKDGYYPLHRACWGPTPRHTETVRVFLKRGVPFDQKSKDGMTCEQMTGNDETKSLLKEMQNGNGEL
eukprot:jgi/Psemu1/257603/estExt_Genewise1Plus.C_2320013